MDTCDTARLFSNTRCWTLARFFPQSRPELLLQELRLPRSSYARQAETMGLALSTTMADVVLELVCSFFSLTLKTAPSSSGTSSGGTTPA